ncbi:putative c-C motif chemokine 13-like isoform 2 [Scophthalmus maximus]|uniref:C-C motif chemokine n=1 Tax=Scophthalmus maximus TaxID=52904 RepID=A0A2U9BAK7_SCOMX|nr:putative c-C motif chemokine 13-like [Scophthalmus maximus]AWP00792.1 putative c-C motif chemokine 13-like isoform 2 [Scophthalmus maximus]
MRALHILLLCVLGAALLSSVVCNNGTGPDDCCFRMFLGRLDKTLIRSYYITDFRCPNRGVILVTRNFRHICVDPNLFWVQSVIKRLDEKI